MAGSGGDASSTPPPPSDEGAGIFGTVASWAGSAVRYAAESVNRRAAGCCSKLTSSGALGALQHLTSAALPSHTRGQHPQAKLTADAAICAAASSGSTMSWRSPIRMQAAARQPKIMQTPATCV